MFKSKSSINIACSISVALLLTACSSTKQELVQVNLHPATYDMLYTQQGLVGPNPPTGATTTPATLPTVRKATLTDQCGASKYAYLVGGPVTATQNLPIANNSRYYGRNEPFATNNPNRLNFVVSTTSAVDAVIDKSSTIIRVFCG